ncbi:MAG TPA: SDR family oxidoreductase [Acidimicrobiia bacterium]|nr:SDR family oxidoreductase [Acidimicrobiia bacterium]
MGALDGKVAAVTGATSGSGRGIAKRFVEEGASVVLLARGPERLAQVVEELGERTVPVGADVGDPDSVRAAFAEIEQRFGRLDILVNNAAVYRPCAVEHLSDDDIMRQVSTNFLGPVYTCRSAIPLMRAAGGGDIVNTSSESTLDPFPMLSMYVATKSALEMFDRILAEELRDEGIRVTTVVQGTAFGPGGGSTGWAWDPEHAAAATDLWTRKGLLDRVAGHAGGQDVEDIGDVHIFIVTRPRTQKLDTVYCRSF